MPDVDRLWRTSVVGFSAAFIVLVSVAGPAEAAVTVSRAEVSGSTLRLEGRAVAGRGVTVDGVRMATAGSGGAFRINRSGYTRPADCTVDVNDGSATAVTVRLSGCTVTQPQPPPPPPSVPLASVSLNPATVQGGSTAAGTATLTAPAPAGGVLVSLTSSNTSAVTVPPTMTVPAGVDSYVTFVSTSPVTTITTALISASAGGVTRTATMTVTPPPVLPPAALDFVFLDPSIVQVGTLSSSATVYFTGLAPAGGASLLLSSSNTAVATVPATVTAPANSSTAAFPVTVKPVAGTTTISATYNGSTRSAPLTVTADSLFRITTDPILPRARVGENYAGFIEACCGQGGPYTWSLVSGTVPDGLRFAGNDLQLTRTTGVTGIAERVQTTTFTVRGRDAAGNTDTETFTLTVDPANQLVITNQGNVLPEGRVGIAYETGLFPGGGVPPWRWSHVDGALPPGMSVQASPGRVRGTPTSAGTFTFTVRVDDSSGQFATRQFQLVIRP